MNKLSCGALLLSLAMPGLAWGELKITGEVKVAPNHIVRLEASGDTDGAGLIWDVSPEELTDIEEIGKRLLFAAGPGTYKVKVRAVRVKDGRTTIETARVTVVVGEPPPPVPPVPPGPVPPGPNPPIPPVPPVPPAPIPTAGFRVLIVEDASARNKLAPTQLAVLFDKNVRDYLRAKCVKGPDGVTGEWRIWDQGADASAEGKLWQEAMKRPRQAVPWIIISDGKTGFEGPLPTTVDETLALLKKYGGT